MGDFSMNYDYKIANRLWSYVCDFPLLENKQSQLFHEEELDGQSDWLCEAKSVEKLPKVTGKLIKESKERRIYLDGETHWIELRNRENGEVLFVFKSSEKGVSPRKLWVLEGMQPFTARIEHIWSAVDFPLQLLEHDILTLHSSVIEVKEEAVLFLAPSCTGKSTQARLWETHRGARQLNGDKAAIMVDVRGAKAYGLPFCGTSNICEKYELPIKAFVILSQAKENRVEQLRGIRAMNAVLSNCFGHAELPGCSAKIMKLLIDVLARVPVYKLACTPDERAVFALERYLQEE